MTQHATGSPVVWGRDDDHTAELLTTHLAAHPEATVTALFEDDEVAALWAGRDGVTARAWAGSLVREVLLAFPPKPVERLAPPPVVVGDSPLAARLVTEIAAGWGGATGSVTIHCVGMAESWAKEASRVVGNARVTWSQVPLQSASLVAAVSSLGEQWQPPEEKRGTRTGPTVYVAASPEGQALAAARAVANQVPGSRVVVLLSGKIAWPVPEQVTVFTVAEVRDQLVRSPEEPTTRLARLLLADVVWLSAPDAAATAPEEPLFPGVRQTGWEGQDESTREQFLAVAAACPRILQAAGLRVERGGARPAWPVVLDPTQLTTMAEQVLALLGVARTRGAWLTALELVAGLPVLAVRAGFGVSPTDTGAQLTAELVELLAPQVHLAYQEASVATDNASGSPLASQLWAGLTDFEKDSNRAVVTGCAVAHAAEGLAWRPTTEQGGVDLGGRLNRLGELEHRRWAIHERRNGRGDHQWQQSWHDPGFTDAMKSYDVRIMAAIPQILADAGVEIYEVDPGTQT